MGPVVTLMMGRIEDWLRVQTERDGIVADPAALPWSGVAVFKRAYEVFRERGFRARLLGAAIRHQLPLDRAHRRRRRHHAAVDLAEPVQRVGDRGPAADRRAGDSRDRRRAGRPLPDFVRAYEPDGLAVDEFDTFPPTRPDAARVHRVVPRAAPPVTDALIPNPDAGRA